jgi:hypothetical protein
MLGSGTLLILVAVMASAERMLSKSLPMQGVGLILAIVGVFLIGLRGGSFATRAFVSLVPIARPANERVSRVCKTLLRSALFVALVFVVLTYLLILAGAVSGDQSALLQEALVRAGTIWLGVMMCAYALLGHTAVPFVRD